MAYVTHRMTVVPALQTARNPFAIPGTGRTYHVAAGSYVDVPHFDAELLASQGWVILARDVVPDAEATAAGLPTATPGRFVYDSASNTFVVGAATGVVVLGSAPGSYSIVNQGTCWVRHVPGLQGKLGLGL